MPAGRGKAFTCSSLRLQEPFCPSRAQSLRLSKYSVVHESVAQEIFLLEYIGEFSSKSPGPYAVKLSICGEGQDIYLDAGASSLHACHAERLCLLVDP